MHRRKLLTLCGTSAVSLSGCMASSGQSPNNPSTQPRATTTSAKETSNSSCSSSTNLSLVAESETFTVTERHDSFLFTLHNQTECPLNIRPAKAWKIEQKSSSGWESVASEGGVGTTEARTLKSGDKHKWSLSLFKHPTPYGQKKTYLFTNLSDGKYSFSVTGTLDDGEKITREAQFRVHRQIS